jgi:hypothetical protein
MKITLPPITQGNWMPCGIGTLLDPVARKPVSTQVIEAECWGRIGEYYDYSNESAANFQAMLAVPAMLSALLISYVALRDGEDRERALSIIRSALTEAGATIE